MGSGVIEYIKHKREVIISDLLRHWQLEATALEKEAEAITKAAKKAEEKTDG